MSEDKQEDESVATGSVDDLKAVMSDSILRNRMERNLDAELLYQRIVERLSSHPPGVNISMECANMSWEAIDIMIDSYKANSVNPKPLEDFQNELGQAINKGNKA